ncbi:FAD:protein FMN transferase [Megasphaera vaginalis (ex Bordigoni et al. 2020)]|uniref:FAD:protein FMN transferase n=1 Tax=Megasphaera vaginalis (ex Bordigoni et al. 2020) TaxID=2045301 RepID=UPI000C7B79FC|nr:FAD:protein FMN transferase [Megasphaera vaginalis (ex Bordigoni et al. 2020)]
MNWKRRVILIGMAAFLVIVNCSGCSLRPEQSYDKSGIAMDTTISLRASGKEAKDAVEESYAKIEELDRLASAQNPQSDVSKINQHAGLDYVQVDPAVYTMIAFAKAYSEKTNGTWDITIGTISQLWGIGTDHARVPDDEEIRAALALVNYHDILLRPEDNSVKLAKKGMYIDLGGIAKGYAVDEVRKIYDAHRIKNGLINLGASSMYGAGHNSKGKTWKIGIKHPRADEPDRYLGIVSVSDTYVSTSGDYERFFEKDGVRYHHIFDPQTGRPAGSGVMSDTIIVRNDIPHAGMLSDMLTTIVFIAGPEKGMALIRSMEGVECEITGTDGTVYMTEGFKKDFSDLDRDFNLEQ